MFSVIDVTALRECSHFGDYAWINECRAIYEIACTLVANLLSLPLQLRP